MRISPKQYAAALFETLSGLKKEEALKKVHSLADILQADNEVYKLDRIIKEFSLLWNKEYSIAEAEISSARQIAAEEEAKLESFIKQKLQAKEVIIKKNIDPSLMGGLVVKYGDKIFDASLKNRLAALKTSIAK